MMNNPLSKLFTLLFITVLLCLLCCSQQTDRGYAHAAGNGEGSVGRKGANTFVPDTLIDKEYLMGRFDPATHLHFMKIHPVLTTIREGYLRQDTHRAFQEMHRAAAADGVRLTIVSATRNFNAQKRIWEAKWDGTRKSEGLDLSTISDPVERARMILRFSSMPGTSRHHWGTDIDINSVDPEYFTTREGQRVYRWLAEHAGTYGFCQTYTPKDSLRPTGYEEEPWHWSYTPVSVYLLQQYLQLITPDDIRGFEGDSTAAPLNVIRDYVAGISRHCM
jgi:zinc D-Ala-D-Ala carboxypeptidase